MFPLRSSSKDTFWLIWPTLIVFMELISTTCFPSSGTIAHLFIYDLALHEGAQKRKLSYLLTKMEQLEGVRKNGNIFWKWNLGMWTMVFRWMLGKCRFSKVKSCSFTRSPAIVFIPKMKPGKLVQIYKNRCGRTFKNNPRFTQLKKKLMIPPQIYHLNFSTFCEEINFSPLVGVVLTNSIKHRTFVRK